MCSADSQFTLVICLPYAHIQITFMGEIQAHYIVISSKPCWLSLIARAWANSQNTDFKYHLSIAIQTNYISFSPAIVFSLTERKYVLFKNLYFFKRLSQFLSFLPEALHKLRKECALLLRIDVGSSQPLHDMYQHLFTTNDAELRSSLCAVLWFLLFQFSPTKKLFARLWFFLDHFTLSENK